MDVFSLEQQNNLYRLQRRTHATEFNDATKCVRIYNILASIIVKRSTE